MPAVSHYLALPLSLHPGRDRGVTALAQMCRLSLLPPIFLSLKTETGMAVMHRIGLEGNFKLSFYLRAVHFKEI